MEPKQSSASPASAGKIVNLSGKHAGTLIKDTPAFPEGASPDVFRKNSRAVKKWLKNVSEYFSLQYAQMIALVIIKALVNSDPDEIKTKDLWRIWALFSPQLELVQRQVHETVGMDTLGLALLVGAKGDFEQYLQPPFKIYFITTQMDKLTEALLLQLELCSLTAKTAKNPSQTAKKARLQPNAAVWLGFAVCFLGCCSQAL